MKASARRALEKNILDLPPNLLHEIFEPLDAKSLLAVAKSDEVLRDGVARWPDKKWEIVHLSEDIAIIDYAIFNREDAVILLDNSQYEDEAEKKAVDSSIRIYDLPLDMLGEIMGPLEESELFSFARAHSQLLHATKHLPNKKFSEVGCTNNPMWHRGQGWLPLGFFHKQTPGLCEILLHRAVVHNFYMCLNSRVPNIEGLQIWSLHLVGHDQDEKAVDIIKKFRPNSINFRYYEVSLGLCEALQALDQCSLSGVGMELFDFITEWKFERLRCHLRNPEGAMPSRFFNAIRTLADQQKNRQRPKFCLAIDFDSKLPDLHFHRYLFGPDYPLIIDEEASYYHDADCPVPINISIEDDFFLLYNDGMLQY